MNAEPIERLAREAGLADFGGWTEASVERFAALIRAEVLEESAKVCDNLDDGQVGNFDGSERCAAAIRALKEQRPSK